MAFQRILNKNEYEKSEEKANEIKRIRREAHQFQNKINAKRRVEGTSPIDTFPKSKWKLKDIAKLKTFIVYDDLQLLKALTPPDFFLYLFKNMLIYQSNLIFDNNFFLEYFFHKVEISVKDFHVLVPRYPTTKIKNCTRDKNTLTFDFDLKHLKSLNGDYQRYLYGKSAKAKQYLIVDFVFFTDFMKKFSVNSKGFLLYLFSVYHHGDTPRILHTLKNIIINSEISMNKTHQGAIDRLNKYFEYLYEHNLVMKDTYKGYFILEELNKVPNLRLNSLQEFKFYSD